MTDPVPARELRDSRLDDISIFLKRHTAPISIALTIVELALALIAFAKILPLTVVVALFIGIPFLFIFLRQRLEIRKLRKLLHETEGRRNSSLEFNRYTTEVVYSPSSVEGYLAAKYISRREIVARDTRRAWTWSISKRSDDDIPFTTGGSPTLKITSKSRSGSGICVQRDFHKSGSNLSFRVEFEPPLAIGEHFNIDFSVIIPAHKSGNLSTLRKRPKPLVPTIGEAELQAVTLDKPTQELTFIAILPISLGTRNHHLQILRGHKEDREEMNFIEKHGLFSVSRIQLEGEDAWKMQLSRTRPPIGVNYRLCWQPPEDTP